MENKPEEMELEIELQQCSHMELKLETLKKLSPSLIEIFLKENDKISIGCVPLKSEEDVICDLTKKPCVLYTERRILIEKGIKYHHLNWCPSSEDSVKKYKLKGTKKGDMFYISPINHSTDLPNKK